MVRDIARGAIGEEGGAARVSLSRELDDRHRTIELHAADADAALRIAPQPPTAP
jgi:hypothetical protein